MRSMSSSNVVSAVSYWPFHTDSRADTYTAAALVLDPKGSGGAPRHCLAGDLDGRVVLEVGLEHVCLAVGLDFESFGIDGLADSYPGARGAVHYDSHFASPVSAP